MTSVRPQISIDRNPAPIDGMRLQIDLWLNRWPALGHLRNLPLLLPGKAEIDVRMRMFILSIIRAGGLSVLIGSASFSLHGQSFLMADGAAWDACAGDVYDSGGPGGNYANNEDLTATLCPAGGSGTLPASSIRFISWNVQPGATDQLFIHDGTSTGDPLMATGNGTTSLAGQTFTATGASGCLTLHWVSDAANTFTGWQARIETGPDAGLPATHTVCSNATAFNMQTLLGGTPDNGGSWTAPGGASHAAVFNPGSDVGGVYTYTVAGTGTCPDASATLTITRVLAPNPGTNGTVSVCSSGAPVQLINSLGGMPDAGGSWTAPGGGAHSGTYDPAVDGPGVYIYLLTGTPPCANASATVTVSEPTPPNAGSNGSISVCSNNGPVALFGVLGGTPDPGGAWTLGGLPVSGTFTPGTSVAGAYVYTVSGIPPCPNAVASVTVAQQTAPNAGTGSSITVCSDQAPFTMVNMLLGTPDAGGSWSGPSPVVGGQFTPASMSGGNYVYTVTGTAPCTNATATLAITLRIAPDAGTNGSITLCSTDADVSLFDELGGTPHANGTWEAPGGGSHSGVFNPGTSTPGTYTYTVTGQAPCTPDVSTVTVTVNNAPNAGANASITRCSDAANVNLFNQLGGSPDGGGTWSGPSVLVNGVFDPGVSIPGLYTYTVNGLAPCANATATVTVTIVQAPNPGTNGSLTVCSIDGSFNLITVLGGTPNGGGSWTRPGGAAHSGTFIPGTDISGIYTYTVIGTSPCANAQATATITVNAAPNAGTNGSVTLCSTDPPETLLVHLGGSPQTGGSWTRPGGASHSGIYDPANVNHPAGIYTYTVAGIAPCPNASATVLVTENQAPNAGNNATTTSCSTDGAFNLFSLLTGGPNATGFWLNPSNNSFTNPFVPGTSPPGIYKYIVPSAPGCDNDTAFVTVNVNTAPNAGLNGALTICSSDAAVPLIASLGGTPDAGGSWTGPSATTGNYNPAAMMPGVYTYTVVGLAPCVNASATVTVTENQQPVAGGNGSIQVCSTDPPFSLFSQLTGAPDPGGTWSGPSATTGTYTPATMVGGLYSYTVLGTAPCTNAQSFVAVTENAAPYAGGDGTLTICENAPALDLFTGLTGNYDLGGSWTDVDGTGQMSGSTFDPIGIAPGMYHFTYEVDDGGGPCGDDEATVIVEIVSQLDAGTNGTITVCGNDSDVDLFTALGGSPQTGGVWIPLGAGIVNGDEFDATSVPPGSYQFRYRLTGTLGCVSDSATATVNVVLAPNAGDDAVLNICSNAGAVNMFDLLGINAQSGGSWTFGGSHSSIYNPAVDVSGVYTYTKAGAAPCPADLALVTVTEYPAPNAGSSNGASLCSNGGAVNMTSLLLGTPAPTGTWTNPLGQVHSATFIPGFDPPGCYTYTVAGNLACPPGTASLCITVNAAPFAGLATQTPVCPNGAPVILFNLLAGAQSGGSWTGPGGPHSGVYIPNIDSAGVYTYTVNGLPPCAPDQTTVTVFENQAPNPGNSTAITLCSNGSAVNLFSQLGGTPDPTGSWTYNSLPHTGIFIPGTSAAGVYTYTVIGVLPCTNASATVTVSVNAPPNAGCNNSIVVCSDQIAFPLFDWLGCTPQGSGAWTFGGNVHSGIFVPGTSSPGCYTYTIVGIPPCANAVATVCVSVNPAANAGIAMPVTLCANSGLVNLFNLLGGSPQPGGTWSNSFGVHSGFFQPGVDPPGPYTYTVHGLAPCIDRSVVVVVTVNPVANAGSNGVITICDNIFPFSLFTVLGGSPSLSGSWKDPFNVAHTGIYVPGVSTPGVYTYTVTGLPPCANATATVTVIENSATDAGSPNVISLCSDATTFQLFDQLLGTPDAGGSWTDPNSDPYPSGSYDPGVSLPGTYTYTVQGVTPCANSSSTVTVQESTAPDAGISTTVLICTTSPSAQLFGLLAGTPQSGGTWAIQGGGTHSGLLNPAVDVSGTYLYTVTGAPPCSTAMASVQVTLVSAPNAGTNGSITACLDDNAINLFSGLGGTFNGGGTWTNVNSEGTLTGGTLDATGVSAGSYQYIYTVVGTSPCANASATVTVTIADELDAGTNATIQVCTNQNAVDLFLALGGTPQTGGNWLNINGCSGFSAGIFNATAASPGSTCEFIYILSASAACLRDSAIVTVEVIEGPDAGLNSSLLVCSSSGIVMLTVPQNGDSGGVWIDPFGAVLSPAQFDPLNDPTGTYSYVVQGGGGCANDTAQVVISVTQAPNAGVSTSVSSCSDTPPFPMLMLLGPDAQSGGQWNGPPPGFATHNGTYVPAIDGSGTYTYTVTGQLPCANVFAQVFVTEHQAPNAGCNNAISICSSTLPFNMFVHVGCTPQVGGTWRGPDGLPHISTFNPAVDLSGTYAYIIAGTSPCVNDTAFLQIQLTMAPDAGSNSAVEACINETCIDLFASLGGTPDANGIWQDLNSTMALTDSCFNATMVPLGIYQFQYLVDGNGPCVSDSAVVTVDVGGSASAGADSAVVICGAAGAFDLFQALGGTADPGGLWSDDLGTGALIDPVAGTLDANALPLGTPFPFTYTITDPGCGDVSATVLVTTTPYPDPGGDSTAVLCSNDDPVMLASFLQGTPDNSGSWVDPLGNPHTGTFDPGADLAGDYTYTVAGSAPCADTSAIVTLVVNDPPDAGSNGIILACDTMTALDLFTGLGGSPDLGGSWTDVDNTGALTGGLLNTTQVPAGEYDFIYTVLVEGCGSDDAMVKVTVVEGVEVGDLILDCNEQDRTYTVTLTISGGDPSTYVVIGLPGTIAPTAPFTFTSDPLFHSQTFTLVVDDQYGCGLVTISGVSPCDFEVEVFIPESFSPNGDGINEEFIIPGIEGYPGNSIFIYNRWGDEVYSADGYDNRAKTWNGTSQNALIPGDLPTGTYYYVLDLGVGGELFKGFIYLNR